MFAWEFTVVRSNKISDLNEQANIAGAGINVAQRIMDCGDAGHILAVFSNSRFSLRP
jgi:hypothetical protein